MAMDVIIWSPQDIHWKVIETRETPINSAFSAHHMLCFEILLLVKTEQSIHQPLEIVNAGPSLRCFPKDQTPTLVHQHLSNQAAFQSRIRIRRNGLLLLRATTHVAWGSSNFDPHTTTATSHYRWFYGGFLGSPASKGYSGYSHLNSTPYVQACKIHRKEKTTNPSSTWIPYGPLRIIHENRLPTPPKLLI